MGTTLLIKRDSAGRLRYYLDKKRVSEVTAQKWIDGSMEAVAAGYFKE